MDILVPEADIVARLKDRLGVKIHVEAFPDNAEAFDFAQPDGACLVRYIASEYTAPVPNRKFSIIQDRSGRWQVAMLHRNLRTHAGVYTLLEAVRKALTGYTPAGIAESTVLYPVNDGFLERRPGKWIYQITFAHTVPEVEE